MSDMHIKGVTLSNRDGRWTRTIFDLKQVTFSCLTRVHPSRKVLLPQRSHLTAAGEGDGCCHVALIRGWRVSFSAAHRAEPLSMCTHGPSVYCWVWGVLTEADGRLLWRALQTSWKMTEPVLVQQSAPTRMSCRCTEFELSVMGERISSLMVSFIFGFYPVFIPWMDANEAGGRSTLQSNTVLNCYCAVIWNGELRLFSS